jgi:hypothetical protein
MKTKFVNQVATTFIALASTFCSAAVVQALPSVGGGGSSSTPAVSTPPIGGSGSSSTPTVSTTGSSTKFQCISSDSAFATIAVAGNKKTNPLITYNSSFFSGSGFTPERRCREISERLETAVAKNGGKLKGLLLTVGEVNGLNVICYVNNNQSACTKRNVLMTLLPGNNPGETLATFLNVVAEPFSSPNPVRISESRTYIPFGDSVERELSLDGENPINSNPIKNNPDNGGGEI